MTVEHATASVEPQVERDAPTKPGLLDARWLSAVILAGLLTLHAAVQWAVRPYPRWGDAMLTFVYARDFPDVPADQHSTRFGVLLPGRLMLEIFGFGQVAYYVYPVLMGVLLVVATFFLARSLFGLVAGAVAGFLIVFNPFLVRTVGNTTSWHLLPDVPAAAWLTAAVGLLVAAATRPRNPSGGLTRGALGQLVAAGLCFGLAYSCREFVAPVFVVIPLVFLLYRLPWRSLVAVATPMAGILVGEMLLAWAVWGNPLVRFSIGGNHGGVPWGGPVTRAESLMKMPDALFAQPRGSVTILMLVLTLAGAAVLWRRGMLIMASWVLSFSIPLLLLGGLLDPDHVSLRVQLTRYWVPMLPAIVVGGVGAVAEVVRTLAQGRSRPQLLGLAARGAVVLLAFLAWYPLPMLRYAIGNPNDDSWNALRSYLARHDGQVRRISTDYRSGDQLTMYSYRPVGGDQVWHGDINIIRSLDSAGLYHELDRVPAASAVNGGALLYTAQTARHRPRPSDGWVLVFRNRGVRLYVDQTSELADSGVAAS